MLLVEDVAGSGCGAGGSRRARRAAHGADVLLRRLRVRLRGVLRLLRLVAHESARVGRLLARDVLRALRLRAAERVKA